MNDATDVLNVERLREAYGDDHIAIANLLGLAGDTELRYIIELRAGIESQDLRAVTRAAHSIKGSASNIGAMPVSLIAAAIEDQAKLGRWDDIPGFADELDVRYAELSEHIAAFAARARGSSTPASTPVVRPRSKRKL